MTDLQRERKGMKLLSTFVKKAPKGKSQTMARIRCPCDNVIVTTLSRWNNQLFDSCRKCSLKRSRSKGFNIFSDGRNLPRST